LERTNRRRHLYPAKVHSGTLAVRGNGPHNTSKKQKTEINLNPHDKRSSSGTGPPNWQKTRWAGERYRFSNQEKRGAKGTRPEGFLEDRGKKGGILKRGGKSVERAKGIPASGKDTGEVGNFSTLLDAKGEERRGKERSSDRNQPGGGKPKENGNRKEDQMIGGKKNSQRG